MVHPRYSLAAAGGGARRASSVAAWAGPGSLWARPWPLSSSTVALASRGHDGAAPEPEEEEDQEEEDIIMRFFQEIENETGDAGGRGKEESLQRNQGPRPYFQDLAL